MPRRDDTPTQSAPIDLIEAEIPHLRRYARYLTRNVDAADDLVQDCMVRAISKIDQWQPGTNMRAWLVTILRNSFYNNCRRSKRETEALRDQRLLPDPVVGAAQESAMELAEVETAFAQLSDEHRDALLLVTVEGMKYEGAAEVMGVSVGTVKSRVSRARKALLSLVSSDATPATKRAKLLFDRNSIGRNCAPVLRDDNTPAGFARNGVVGPAQPEPEQQAPTYH